MLDELTQVATRVRMISKARPVHCGRNSSIDKWFPDADAFVHAELS